jgi:2-phosphosulfolactate phosphatase
MVNKSFLIKCLTENEMSPVEGDAAVAIDVIRSTTVAVTIAESGRKCFYAPTVDAALGLASKLESPLLIGEVGGNMPYGFDLTNSPAEIERIKELVRPAIIVSTSGTPLMNALRHRQSAYVACLRNYTATTNLIIARHNRVLIASAPTRGEFREEDQLCSAWIGKGLMKAGYSPKDDRTAKIVDKWKNASVEVCSSGKSAEYLRRTRQLKDLDYILAHVNDLNAVFAINGKEIVKVS